jgi:hypothetical protein
MLHIGIKVVNAMPQVEGGFAQAGNHGGVVARDGYKVAYVDNYISWSPKEAFEEAYIPLTDINNWLIPEVSAPHQQRVVEEFEQLLEKYNALVRFIDSDMYKSLLEAEQQRLFMQSNCMRMYLEILKERILNF